MILLGTLLGPLDSAVNIAFPDITRSFGLELQSIRWVVIAYVATYASLMLVFGRIGDLFGHALVFHFGLLICIAGFVICSLAEAYEWFLAARVLQGMGTAMVLSCGPALVTNLYDEAARARVLGIYAMMFGLGGAVGPSLGGILVDYWGWPAVFLFRLPLAVVALLGALLLRLPSPDRDVGNFDLPGAILLATATALLLLTISQAAAAASAPYYVAALVIVTICAIAAFLMASRRARSPVLDIAAFRSGTFTWINLTNIAVNLAGFATMLFVPYFLVRVTELPLWQSGLVMAVGPLGMTIAANIGGRLIPTVGSLRLAVIGTIAVAAGLGWISTWNATTTTVELTAALFIHGAGLGLFQVASLEIVASALPRTNRGVAGSLAFVMRTVGVVIAASTLTLAFTQIQHSAADPAAAPAFVEAFQTVFRFCALGLLLFLALSVLPRLGASADR